MADVSRCTVHGNGNWGGHPSLQGDGLCKLNGAADQDILDNVQMAVCENKLEDYTRFCPCIPEVMYNLSSATAVINGVNATARTAKVFACSSLGCSSEFTAASITVPDRPNAVSVVVAGTNSLFSTIEPPERDGGAEITHLQIVVRPKASAA